MEQLAMLKHYCNWMPTYNFLAKTLLLNSQIAIIKLQRRL